MEAQDIQSAHEIQSVLEATHLNGQTSEEALESGALTDSALQVGLAPSASSIALQAMGAPSAGGGAPSAARQPGSFPGQVGISTAREDASTPQESSSMLLQAERIMQQANGPPDSTPQQARQPAQHAASSAHAAPSAPHQAGRAPPQADSAVQAANGFMSGAARPAHQAGSAVQPAGSGALQTQGPMQQRCFTEELAGVKACFQLVDLGRQIYVWAGTSSGAMGCMCLASPPSPTGDGALPPVATLLRGSADSAASSAAQRLARKTGRSVALAWALPEQPPMLAILAERSIVEGLAEMSLVQRGG
ncbi:hypothetical protein CVIRNUC_006325 [Coccomyxa viridis]|uniref:Uncharacterized protein n=1 Tax=Coccomyxa viridis TaxID=1274662 RepID=A0AAV1I7T5_9CHLO|nr:hypothetical protein CVIRNUC_006325 [Coccomyxa viridis]